MKFNNKTARLLIDEFYYHFILYYVTLYQITLIF